MAKEIHVSAWLSHNVEACAHLGQSINFKGSNDYNRLSNKPKIEGVELVGDLTFPQLNLSRITNSELEELLNL